MSNLRALPSADALLHSHSDLTRQIEELESHANALRITHEDRGFILEDLLTFARRFAVELSAHISQEESVVFPMYLHLLNDTARAMLQRIHKEHREMEDSLERLLAFLDAAEEAEILDDDLIESIHIRARLLNYAFAGHTERERLFFEEVAQSLP